MVVVTGNKSSEMLDVTILHELKWNMLEISSKDSSLDVSESTLLEGSLRADIDLLKSEM